MCTHSPNIDYKWPTFEHDRAAFAKESLGQNLIERSIYLFHQLTEVDAKGEKFRKRSGIRIPHDD